MNEGKQPVRRTRGRACGRGGKADPPRLAALHAETTAEQGAGAKVHRVGVDVCVGVGVGLGGGVGVGVGARPSCGALLKKCASLAQWPRLFDCIKIMHWVD